MTENKDRKLGFQSYHEMIQNNKPPQITVNKYDVEQSIDLQSQSAGLAGGVEVKRSPVKYRYLSAEEKHQRERESSISWLQCFAMFIFIYSSTCSKQNTGVDFAFFVGIMMAIPICAKQTGANLNPAVSYSMTFKTAGFKFSYHSLLWLYVKSQIVGAILSMIVAVLLNDVYRQPLHPSALAGFIHNEQQYEYSIGFIFRLMLSQAMGVFILIFFILYATGPFSFITNNGAKYFFIAVFVYIGRRFAIISGNQINLALTISQAFIGFPLCDFKGFKYLYIWLIGDIAGVILATALYNGIVEPTLDYMERHKTQKFKSKLEEQRQMQMMQFKNGISKLLDLSQQQSHNRKLQYF